MTEHIQVQLARLQEAGKLTPSAWADCETAEPPKLMLVAPGITLDLCVDFSRVELDRPIAQRSVAQTIAAGVREIERFQRYAAGNRSFQIPEWDVF